MTKTPIAHGTDASGAPVIPRHLERLSDFLDNAIRLPGGYRVGWDGIIGLLPGLGDIIGLSLSAYIVAAAARLGASKAVLARMCANVALETVVGIVPVVGDLFDLGYKANARNLRLMRSFGVSPALAHRRSALWMLGLMSAMLATALLMAWLMYTLLSFIIRTLTA